MDRSECGGIGWIDSEVSETAVEEYSMTESNYKSSLEGERTGEFKVRNDWETHGQ